MAQSARFDSAFLAAKRQQLLALRDELRAAAAEKVADEAGLNAQAGREAREYEDDAQKLALLEIDGQLVSRDVTRQARVERAIAKIDDGTYGFSDVSGARIPDERLEAMPDAINTVQEQERGEIIE